MTLFNSLKQPGDNFYIYKGVKSQLGNDVSKHWKVKFKLQNLCSTFHTKLFRAIQERFIGGNVLLLTSWRTHLPQQPASNTHSVTGNSEQSTCDLTRELHKLVHAYWCPFPLRVTNPPPHVQAPHKDCSNTHPLFW